MRVCNTTEEGQFEPGTSVYGFYASSYACTIAPLFKPGKLSNSNMPEICTWGLWVGWLEKRCMLSLLWLKAAEKKPNRDTARVATCAGLRQSNYPTNIEEYSSWPA